VNNSERQEREFADIESIIQQYATQLDWKVLEEYFNIFKKQERFSKLRDKYYAN